MIYTTIFMFLTFNFATSNSSEGIINSLLDSVCLTSPSLNVTVMNDRLVSCRGNKQVVPIANLEKAITTLCDHIQSDINCFQETIKVWLTSNCIKPGKENIFKLMIKVFKAGRIFKCLKKRDLFKDYLSPKGEKCVKIKQSALDDCSSSIEFVEPWETLETLYIHSKDPYSIQECRQKGLWTYCAIAQLDECEAKTAMEFYKGFYGSMLIASPCKKVITKEFPALERSAISLAFINTINYLCLIFSWFLVFISNL